MTGRIVVVGSLNLDQVVRVEHLPAPGETVIGTLLGNFPGGKGFNQAFAAHRSGAYTTLCGQVGGDAAGAFLRKAARDAGLNDSQVGTSPTHATAMAQIAALPGGENAIVVIPGANLALDSQRAVAAVDNADVLLVQMEISPETVMAVLEAARRQSIRSILNAAPAHAVTSDILAQVDVLVVNETELATLGGLEKVLRAGPTDVVVTLGSKGAFWTNMTGERLDVAAHAIIPVDTTGAGDAFCGTLAASLAMGLSMPDAMRRASAAGAIVACALGAQTSRLSAAAIDQMLAAPLLP